MWNEIDKKGRFLDVNGTFSNEKLLDQNEAATILYGVILDYVKRYSDESALSVLAFEFFARSYKNHMCY